MAKKKSQSKNTKSKETLPEPQTPKLTPEMEKKLKDIKSTLDKFKKKILDKFGDYITGIALLPPEKQVDKEKEGKDEKEEKNEKESKKQSQKINVLVLVDDTTSKKMSKEELKEKFSTIIEKLAKETDEKIATQSLLLSELWQNCYDGKGDLLKLIAMSAPVYDTGVLSGVKITEIHKSMVLKKFEKYIVSYVLVGSLPRGKATPTSDIDVWIIIDDTDVKKMTRAELKDKLRAIIMGMALEAGEITGIKNKLSCQVHILTDVWESLKEANPVVFTFLRDGVPFFDRGMFMPWKLMLKMGKVKPSREAIDMFMSTGDQMLKRVRGRIKDMGMEDIYYSILTPSQAALMLYGLPPPIPTETPEVMKHIFVDKEKILEPEYVKILEHNVDLRKKLEHGDKKELTGKELDELLQNAEKYLKRIQRLFKQIEKTHQEESVAKLYDEVVTIIRDVLNLEGVEKTKDEEIITFFEDKLISTGKVPARYLRDLNEVIDAKKDYELGKLSKAEIEKARKGGSNLIKFLIEHIQRKRGRELDRAKIKIKHGDKFGEIILLDKIAFIFRDIDAKEKTLLKAPINTDGSLGTTENATLEEFEKELVKIKFPQRVFIKETVFESIKNIFGGDVEVLVSH
ncbi:hypothetical protein GOV03_04125 [Candidatus Woesearchaeota archaeon]|nr:hypothetical protein [Candidatus Woesearchaeota archaeon]